MQNITVYRHTSGMITFQKKNDEGFIAIPCTLSDDFSVNTENGVITHTPTGLHSSLCQGPKGMYVNAMNVKGEMQQFAVKPVLFRE